MAFHFIVRFEPLAGKEGEFREELLKVSVPSRAEAACLRLEVFESIREPVTFSIHSVWTDEQAFEFHSTLPHTVKFIEAAEKLLTHPLKGLRLEEIGV